MTKPVEYYEIDGIKYIVSDVEIVYEYVHAEVLYESISYPDVEDPTKTATRRAGDIPLMRKEHALALLERAEELGISPPIRILAPGALVDEPTGSPV